MRNEVILKNNIGVACAVFILGAVDGVVAEDDLR